MLYLRDSKWQALSLLVSRPNHPVRSHEEHTKYLSKLGLSIKQEELITPLDGLKRFFSKVDVPYSVYVAGSTMVKRKLRDWKIPVIERSYEQRDNSFVVLGMSFNLNYAMLQEAYKCIQTGATLLVLNPDNTCPSLCLSLPNQTMNSTL